MRVIGCLIVAALALSATAEELTLERIFASPDLAGESPRRLKISPEGRRVTFLRGKEDDREQLDLWQFDVDTGAASLLVDSLTITGGAESLSEAEAARRERQRIAGLKGIVDYVFSPKGDALLFPLNGDIYWHDLTAADEATRALVVTEAFETDPKVSPQGDYVSFIRDNDLFVVDVESGDERQLTTDGSDVVSSGVAEFIAQEEMDRDTGYWWSPNDRYIAFIRVDRSPIPVTQRYEIYADELKVIEQRYPYAGEENVRVRLGVVEAATGDTRWVDTGADTDIYIPRVKWLPDSRAVSYQLQSRDQRQLELRVADVADGRSRVVLTETAREWINLHHDLFFLESSEQFVWSSERSGYRHLYLYDVDGTLIRALTGGDWAVDELEAVDEERGVAFFSAAKDSPLEKHLYRQRLDGGELKRVTRDDGWNDVSMADDGSIYINRFSNRDQPPQVALNRADGTPIAWLAENALDERHPYTPYLDAHGPTTFGTLIAVDEQVLHYRLTRPTDFDPRRRYPVMVHVYGGPHVQMVNRQWGRRILFEQYMAQRGFLVFALDNRGSDRRGVAFETPISPAMGGAEVKDQLVGVEWLKDQAFVDPDRVGVFGWSYGGYMTLMLLAQAPDAFAAGVSVAPVTEWRLYDTHYTERYLGHPGEEADAYDRSALWPYIDSLKGPLLLIHGMADDNVLFTHSTRLTAELTEQGTLFEMMVYPGAKHGISGAAAQRHVFGTIADFLERKLVAKPPQ